MTKFTIAISLFLLLMPSASTAQAAEACGSDDILLMHCSFDNGAKQVGLCQSGNMVSYAFGAHLGRPELSLSSTLMDIQNTPFDRIGGQGFEIIRFHNGVTSYDVYSAIKYSSYDLNDGPYTTGGITIRSPGTTPQTLTCDIGTVTPRTPYRGIGQIADAATTEGIDLLSNCLDNNPDAASCLGAVQRVDIREHDCIPENDWTECWAHEADVWYVMLRSKETSTNATLKQLYGDDIVSELVDAQDFWSERFPLACHINGGRPFAVDWGEARCMAEQVANRIDFLQSVIDTGYIDR